MQFGGCGLPTPMTRESGPTDPSRGLGAPERESRGVLPRVATTGAKCGAPKGLGFGSGILDFKPRVARQLGSELSPEMVPDIFSALLVAAENLADGRPMEVSVDEVGEESED